MIFDSPMLIWPYVVPFLIALVMPGWRSLAVISFAAVALFAWLLVTKVGGPDWLGVLLFGLAGVGLVAGILTRALTLAIAPLRQRPLLFVLIALIGFSITPILIAGPEAAIRWIRQPPTLACYDITLRVRLAGQTLYVPMAPIFSLYIPKGEHQGDRGGYQSLSRNSPGGHRRYIAELCRRTVLDGEVFAPAAVRVHSGASGQRAKEWLRPRCSTPETEGMQQVCQFAARQIGRPRLGVALLYGPELSQNPTLRFNRMVDSLPKWVELYNDLVGSEQKARAVPTDSKPNGASFRSVGDGVRISTAPDLVGPSGEPFALKCTGDQVTRCVAAGTFSNGVRVIVRFEAYPDVAEPAARMYFRNLNDLVQALAIDPKSKKAL